MDVFEPLHRPVRINPLIRASRYVVILMGIMYGYKRRQYLEKATQAEQTERMEQIKRRNTNREIKSKIIGEAELIDLAKQVGVTPKAVSK